MIIFVDAKMKIHIMRCELITILNSLILIQWHIQDVKIFTYLHCLVSEKFNRCTNERTILLKNEEMNCLSSTRKCRSVRKPIIPVKNITYTGFKKFCTLLCRRKKSEKICMIQFQRVVFGNKSTTKSVEQQQRYIEKFAKYRQCSFLDTL